MTDDSGPGRSADSGERYERAERIATGGMGEVWRARDTVLGREVAVKVLKHEYADDPTFRARFEAEARHAASLHHPGIASVFDYGMLKEGQTPYLVMELVEGKPLSELLAGGRPFDPEQARMLALQTAEALAVAHDAGVIHRDVKPGNLMVTPEGQVKITDFGIARASDSVSITQTGQIVGTPHYLSPEQARGNAATAASDVYALGVVLFECLSGHRPFEADTPIATALAQIQQDVPPLPDTVPPALAAVVTRALAKDPAERYANGGELAAALREAAEGGTTIPVPAPVPAPEQTQVLAPTAVAATPDAAPPNAAPPNAAPPNAAPPDEDPQDRVPTTKERSRLPWYAAGLLVLALIAALLITHPWTNDAAPTDDGTNSTPAANDDTVRVRRADYIGEPVDDVEQALSEKGLETRTETQDNPGGEEAGTVADLSPTGLVDKGETITLQAWGEPPATEPGDQGDQGDEGDNSGPGSDNSGPGKPEQSDKPPKPEKSDGVQPGDEPTGGSSGGSSGGTSGEVAPDAGSTADTGRSTDDTKGD